MTVEALPSPAPTPTTYVLTRFVLLRLLGLVYATAFLVFLRQGMPLIGHDGLLPADTFITAVSQHLGSTSAGFLRLPSLFWFHSSDGAMLAVGWVGFVLALATLAGFANSITLALQWALYMSIVHVGQLFWGYGWEIQLLETGFLAIFLVPLLDPRPFPTRPPPVQVIWLQRWLIFRIMLGAGLIKLRGDPCWHALTCLDTFFETEPMPNPLTPAFHFMPHWVHATGVAFNHVAELVCPFLALGPKPIRRIGGALMLAFQVILIVSGNLSFLNYLTIVPILACFDDALLARVLPARLVRRASLTSTETTQPQRFAAWTVTVIVGVLSLGPVTNLLSSRQVMNTGFDPFELVNSYGAFGSVGEVRHEIVVEGTSSPTPDANAEWKPYEFVCKPTDVTRRPCQVAPYQEHLDWQMWFAAMSDEENEPWFGHFVWKLLHNDRGARSLLANDPFPDAPPRWIRARLFTYRFAPLRDRAWWQRTEDGVWMPPRSLEDPYLRALTGAYGWPDAP